MKKKKFKLWIILMVIALGTSCRKESFEPSVVKTNTLIDQANPNSQEHKTGGLLLPKAEYNKLPKAPETTYALALPSNFTLTCPGIRDQGGESSCVAWATAYAARSIMARIKTGGSFSFSKNVMSPAYVYNLLNGGSCDIYLSIPAALNLIKDYSTHTSPHGVCHWTMMPYIDGNCDVVPNTSQMSDAANHAIVSYSAVTISASSIKNQVYSGHPVMVIGPTDANFHTLGTSNYSSYSGPNVGNHAYCVVGWNARRNAFKVMNSWGTSWGDGGFGWISYDVIGTLFHEAYIMDI